MAATQVVKTAAGTAISVNGIIIDPTGATAGQVLTLTGGKFVPGAGGGGSTGNWTFTGNVADLTGAGAITIGGATSTSISLAKAAVSLAANTVFTGASSATNTIGTSLAPNVADGASSVALDVNNGTTLANATASLFRLRNNGTARMNATLASTDGINLVDGAGTSMLQLSTAIGGKLIYGASNIFCGSANVSATDGTGTLNLAAGNLTLTIFQGIADGDGTRDWGLVGTRWRVGGFKRIAPGRFTVTSSATPAFDPANGDKQRMILTANVTSWTFAAGLSGETVTIEFIQDGTGSRTLAGTPANVKLAGAALTLSTGVNKRDLITFEYDSTDSNWYERSRALNC